MRHLRVQLSFRQDERQAQNKHLQPSFSLDACGNMRICVSHRYMPARPNRMRNTGLHSMHQVDASFVVTTSHSYHTLAQVHREGGKPLSYCCGSESNSRISVWVFFWKSWSITKSRPITQIKKQSSVMGPWPTPCSNSMSSLVLSVYPLSCCLLNSLLGIPSSLSSNRCSQRRI